MEVALIPGVLALGESIACQLGYAAAEYQSNTNRRSIAARSHPGIFSNNNSDVNSTRTHSGIYCNPTYQRTLPPVAETCQLPESQSYYSEISGPTGLDHANSPLLSARSGCDSEVDSPCPTARLALPNKFSAELAEVGSSHSPSTRDLLAPTVATLCPPRSGSPFGMPSPRGERLTTTQTSSTKRNAGCAYLLDLSELTAKHPSSASNSTSSTCSDLDISCRTVSAVSSSDSNASEQQIPESVYSEEVALASPRSEILLTAPVGASPIDQTVVVAPAGPVSKARSFCRQAFAECDLDNMDDELAEVAKDLEMLRASMATSKRVLCA